MNKDKLISLIIRKETYKDTKPFLNDLAAGKEYSHAYFQNTGQGVSRSSPRYTNHRLHHRSQTLRHQSTLSLISVPERCIRERQSHFY